MTAHTLDPDPHLVAGVPALAILEQLPTGVLVIDKQGAVRYANETVLGLLDWPRDDYLGRSVLETILPEDLGYAAEVMEAGPNYFGLIMGPMRIHYQDGLGRRRVTEFWGRELDDRSGYILVVPEESTPDMLAEAVESIASGQPIEHTASHIAASFRVYPLVGTGCLLRVGGAHLEPITPWPLDGAFPVNDELAPWAEAVRTGRPVEVNVDDVLPDNLRVALVAAGHGAVWAHPVTNQHGEIVAVLVAFRQPSVGPSPNQERRLGEIVAVAALAFDQAEHLSALKRAAFTDPLTGVSTRTLLDRKIAAGSTAGAAVLYLDLDGFKQINDHHGHLVGDDVLIEAADRIKTIVRSQDLVVRMGGDEFVCVLRGISEADARAVVDRLVDELGRPYRPTTATGVEVVARTSVSVGLSFQTETMSFDDALRSADRALASAKHQGKDRWMLGHAPPIAGD